MTLIELTIALGLSSLVVMAGIKVWNYLEQSTRASETEKDAKSDAESLVKSIENSWLVRQRPINPSTLRPIPFTATQKGFTLRTTSGAPCAANCPRITISVENQSSSGASILDSVDVTTRCIDPGQVPGKTQLNLLNFADPTFAGSCISCSSGTIPIVTYSSQKFPADNQQYPSNSRNLPQSFRITKVLGMSTCWDQAADGPAFLSIGTYMLKNQNAASGLKFRVTKKLLPFDNFSQKILKPKIRP